MRTRLLRYPYVMGLLLLFSGCAGHPKEMVDVTASAAPGQKVKVMMKASNYAFDPAVIVARTGETLILSILDVSGERHNITVKDPAGKIIASEDVPGHQTVTLEIPLETAGTYPFYCDKPFHSKLGMKGRIEVK